MKKHYMAAHGYFTLWVFLLSLLPLFSYWQVMPRPDGLMSDIYRLSTLGYYGLLLGLVALICLPLSQWRQTRSIYALLLASWLLYLFIDVATFNLYLFHVDWLMIEMFIMDFSGMGIPPLLLALTALAAIAAIAGLLWLGFKTTQLKILRYQSPLWIALGLSLCLFATNSAINIWATHYQRQEISYINPYFPLYRPVTSNKHAMQLSRWLPRIFVAEFGKMDRETAQEKSVVQYPLQPLACTPMDQPESILVLLVESWQAETLRPDIMPNLSRFSEQAVRFDQHLSGGSATVPGLFSLFFGLHASYYPVFKATPGTNPSQFTETLNSLGYHTQVYTNTNLERFAVRQLLFPHLTDKDFYNSGSDRSIVNQYLRNHATHREQPQFDLVFLTSSHSPYKYPNEFAYFHPLPSVKAGFVFDNHTDNVAYKNDYYNSLVYVDDLLGDILQQLEKTGALENTWVIITGDHGEEFNENQAGFWGHGSNFTHWQTQTPLLVRPPNSYQRRAPHSSQQQAENADQQQIAQPLYGRRENRLSTHQDLVPTLMREALNCTTPAQAYSNGENLFDLPAQRQSVISSYYNHAYWVDGTVLDRSTGKQYAWDNFSHAAAPASAERLRKLREEERRFLKSKAELKK